MTFKRFASPAVVALAAIFVATAQAATPDNWTAANPLSTARNEHVAALLGSGKVLVAGGSSDGSTCLNSTEVYDPSAGTWSAAAPMGTARCDAAAATLPGGKVLVVGGGPNPTSPSGALDTGEVYDPSSNTWTPVSNPMSSKRFLGPVAVAMPNGRVLIAGGVDTSATALASADVYNPATNTFSPTGSMGTGRAAPVAVLLSTGNVLVAGGTGGSPANTALSSGEVYSPTGGNWTPVSNSTAQPRAGAGGAALPGGRALVAGGAVSSGGPPTITEQGEASTDIYNASTNRFTAGAAMATPRADFGAASLSGGRVLVAGGFTTATITFFPSPAFNASVTNSSEVYDSARNSFKPVGPLPTAVLTPTFTRLTTGQVLSAGGGLSDGQSGSKEAARFTPSSPSTPGHAKPELKLSHLHKRMKRRRLLAHGLKFTVMPNEAVKLRVSLLAKGKRAHSFTIKLARKTFPLSALKRKVALRPNRRRFQRSQESAVQLVIVATDAAGDVTTLTRKIKLG